MEFFDDGDGQPLRLLRYKEFKCNGKMFVVFVSAEDFDEDGDPYIYAFEKSFNENSEEVFSAAQDELSFRLSGFLADLIAGRKHFFGEDEADLQIELPDEDSMTF